jgi:hypothetical protein
MPPEDEEEPEDADQWAAEREERAPEFMEPVVEVDEADLSEVDTLRDRKERDAASSTLYRERRVMEEVVEEDVTKPSRPTREERRAAREQRRLDREVHRLMARKDSRIRSSLAYKTFYDAVCNRVGVIVAGFGVAMILFTVSYDWLQGNELSLGRRHWIALIISITVYGIGMALEGLRILSPECEGLEAKALRAQAAGQVNGGTHQEREEPKPVPMIPDDALEKLNDGDR